ncbi:GGDEF domain-containing protein [Virgisporangium aurantiacum]|nr:GGDEF domain-containing protein [Virgisporangium aurantiacum]
MRSRMFVGYVVVMAGMIGFYPVVADHPWLGTAWQVAIGWSAAAVTVLGVLRYRPPGRAAWLFFAAGVFLNTTGIPVATLIEQLQGPTYPSIADALWLALYPCLVAGMLVVQRRHRIGGNWTATLDSATITAGLALLSWVYVIRPSVHDASLTLVGHVVVASYPIGDVVVLAMTTRLLIRGGWRLPALRAIVGAMGLLLVGDILWVIWSQAGFEVTGLAESGMSMIFLTVFATIGSAALHPSMRQLGEPLDTGSGMQVRPTLLVALTVAALVGPVVLTTQALSGKVTDAFAIAASSTVLFLLVVTRLAGLVRHIEAQSRQLRELARTDALTGLSNRRDWTTHLPHATELARRSGEPMTVVMIDLDHFKRFNDEFGHPAGDRLLKSAAAAWQEQIRAVDKLARYGGEEFILLLPGAPLGEAVETVERLRAVTPLGQTFSAGAAEWTGEETSDELVARADRALYAAKHGGRNRTEVAESEVAGSAVTARS